MVQERLIEAWGLLMRMPDREAGWLRVQTMALWRQVSDTAGMSAVERAEYLRFREADAPRAPGLTRDEVARMEEVIGWLGWIKPDSRRIVGVAIGQLWRGAARVDWRAARADPRLSGSADRARMAYQRAITAIARRLSGMDSA